MSKKKTKVSKKYLTSSLNPGWLLVGDNYITYQHSIYRYWLPIPEDIKQDLVDP